MQLPIRVEDGQGLVQMGERKDWLNFRQPVYAPPNHPWGTIHQTKEAAEAGEG